MLDFTPLSDDQLVDLIRAACQEAARRGTETRYAAESVALDEATKARIAREATEKATTELHREEARRIEREAAERVRQQAEKAARDAESAKIAETWKYKEQIGAQISAIIKPTRNCELKVWNKGSDRRIYIGGGYDDNDVVYHHTGNHKEKPRAIRINASRDVAITKDDIDKAQTLLLPVLAEICDKWSAITIPIPEYKANPVREILLEIAKCTICGKEKPKQECTRLIGLGATHDGWECGECHQAACETGKLEFEHGSFGDHYNQRGAA